MEITEAVSVFLVGLLGITVTAGQTTEKGEESTMELVKRYLLEYPEYVAMVGMAIMILLLFITVLVILCCYTGGSANREEDYKTP